MIFAFSNKMKERDLKSSVEPLKSACLPHVRCDVIRGELDLYCKDSDGLHQMKKEVLRLERELMQQKNKNKVLQAELENPLNVHRYRKNVL